MTEKDLIIQDLRRENAELRARVPQWISVNDRLPEAGEYVVCMANFCPWCGRVIKWIHEEDEPK